LLRREVAPLVDPEDMAAATSTESAGTGSALGDLPHHAIVDRGRLVGYWEYDAVGGELVWATFRPATAAVRAAVDAMARFVADELGDARTFSLDSPESRGPRLARLRQGWAAKVA
jgi:hypothetical protein